MIEKWCFSDNKKEANKLFELVKNRVKTATSYLYVEDENKVAESDYSILTNWDGSEELLLKTIKKEKVNFNQVKDEHAFKEGEGDKSLDYWKKVHKKFFKKEAKRLKIVFDENTPIICEEFLLVQKK